MLHAVLAEMELMRFAFSTLTCPAWDAATLAARAREFGYDGVEWAADIGNPQTLHDTFDSAGVEIACLSGPVLHTGRASDDDRQADAAKTLIVRAVELGCPRVKIFNTLLPLRRRGQSASAAGLALGEWLSPLADFALDGAVTLLIENAPGLRTAAPLWAVLDRLRHPALACCWDPFHAALLGESPSLSVPVLNSRIQFAHVRDGRRTAEDGATDGTSAALTACKLGEGDVQLAKFIARLRGVGFGGYVSAVWDGASLTDAGPPEKLLPDALAKLKQWAKGSATSPVSKVAAKPTSTPREVPAKR